MSYLEIGIQAGETFNKVDASVKVGVDPDSEYATHKIPSDVFFSANTSKFDIIFIDGLHTYDQVYRDIRNSIGVLTQDGTIVIHDCSPPNGHVAGDVRPAASGTWCGTVWKAIIRLRMERLGRFLTVDTDYGCGILTPRASDKPISTVDLNHINGLDFNFFDTYRNVILNFVSETEFLGLVRTGALWV